MRPRLYSLALSHPARAVHAMLELKRIDHEVVDLLPGMHPVRLRTAGFRGGTVPALRLDGDRIQGSLQISRFSEELVPQPPLFPVDPGRRSAVVDAEAWGEAELQPVPRRIFRWGARAQRHVRLWIAELSGIPVPGLAAIANAPVAALFARQSEASEDRVRADLASLPGALDRVDAWIANGALGGSQVNAADCQIASTVRVLLAYEDLRPMLEGRPSSELAMRLFPSYPEPIPIRLPASWLPAGP